MTTIGFRRKRLRRVLLAGIGAGFLLVVTFVGPWPTYGRVDLESTAYFQQAIADLAASAARSERTASPGRLRAGWAVRVLALPPGTPLAGYGDRRGRPAAGVHDDLHVKALVLSDGADAAAVVASDLLIVPENVAGAVRSAVARRVPLAADDLLFNASHTHSGPGAFAPGWVARRFAGEHDPAVVAALVDAMTGAVVEAYEELEPARLGHGKVVVPEHVHNRTRATSADPDLSFMVVEKDDGRRATVVSYAAHATLLRGDNMELSAGYPGALARALEHETGGTALFLAGAVGSMGPVAPDGLAGYEAVAAMGRSLASRVAAEIRGLALADHLDVASAGIPITMPPLQVRLNRWLRLSPLLVRGLGIDNRAWLGGVRVGETVLVGTPGDFSGELSGELEAWASALGYDLWVLSFNGDYVGYVSPDRYYDTASRQGREGYEMYVMSWCGPQQGEFLVRLIRRTVEVLSWDSKSR